MDRSVLSSFHLSILFTWVFVCGISLVEADIEVKLIVYLIFLFIDLWGLTLSDGFSLTVKPVLLPNFFSTKNKCKFSSYQRALTCWLWPVWVCFDLVWFGFF